MKVVTALTAVSLLLPGQLLAAAEYDTCVREEKTLRTEEKEKCSGLSYLLNPSGCFIAQKALRAFHDGRCPEIIKAGSRPAPPPPATPPSVQAPLPAPPGAQPVAPPVAPPAEPPPVRTQPLPAAGEEVGTGTEHGCDRLRDENVRLRAEINRLRSEIEQLRMR